MSSWRNDLLNVLSIFKRYGDFKVDRRSVPTSLLRSMATSTSSDYTSLNKRKKDLHQWLEVDQVLSTDTKRPGWKFGDGATDGGECLDKKHVEIDPFAPGRSWFRNYTLLVSGIVPRPIGFVSTLSKDGTPNLAPFSYFQCIDHNPPVFVFGFTGRNARPKDTLRNLADTGECVINSVSEHMIEAVNATSIDIPYEASEWNISGLHKAHCTTVKPPRVRESVFSVECKLLKISNFDTSRPSEGPHGHLAVVEGTRFWVREDAIDSEESDIDINVLRPVGQLGGISYARVNNTFDLPRSSWQKEIKKPAGTEFELLAAKKEGQ